MKKLRNHSLRILICTFCMLACIPQTNAQPYNGIEVNSQVFTDNIWFFGTNWSTWTACPSLAFVKNSLDQWVPQALPANERGKVNSWENSLSVSTPSCDGSFIFYTMHNQVYNSKHQPMDGGSFSGNTSVADGLAACYIGENKYLLFSCNTCYFTSIQLLYYEIDMSANGGLGKMTSKGSIETEGMSESIELIPVANTTDEYWLVYHHYSTSQMRVRKVTPAGVSSSYTFINKPGLTTTGNQNYSFLLKSNPTYNRLVLTMAPTQALYLFHFDPVAGTIAFDKSFSTASYITSGHLYNAEFSHNGKYIYFNAYNHVNLAANRRTYQYDIATNSVLGSFVFNNSQWTGTSGNNDIGGGMKRGPDGKIYVGRSGTSYLGIIEKPDLPITNVNFKYTEDGINLGVVYDNLPLSTGITPPAIDPITSAPPTANPDIGSTNQYLPVTVNVLANDGKGGGSTLTLTKAFFSDQSKSGQGEIATNDVNGTITFTPNPDYDYTGENAIVNITYVVQNNSTPIAMCNSGTLTITVTPTHVRSTLFSDDVWFFGLNHGLLEDAAVQPTNSTSKGIIFENIGGNMVPKDASRISKVNARENSLSVSTPACNGSYIFYTQHDKVYRSNHEEMGSFAGDYSCSDGVSAAYLGDNKYVLFSVTGIGGAGGLTYYIIDMGEANGLGTLSGAIANLETGGVGESSELIPKVDTYNEYWLVTTHPASHKIKVRSVSAQPPATTSAPKIELVQELPHTFSGGFIYSLKPNGTYTTLALANADGNKVDLFNFNPATGQLKYSKSYAFSGLRPYGVEFSPNGKYLYVGFYGSAYVPIRQINLLDDTILQLTGGTEKCVDIKLGPDGKIYVMRDGKDYMGVINNPNEPITNAGNYVANGLKLSSNGGGIKISTGLTPPWINPSTSNQEPNVTDDVATTTSVNSIAIKPLENDTDADGHELNLVGVEFATAADEAKGTVMFDADAKEVTFTPSPTYPFTDYEKVNIIYTVRDNGLPVALCAKGNIEVTVRLAKLSVSFSETEVDEGDEVSITICMPDETKAPSGGLPFNLNLAASSTADASDYEVIGITKIPAGEQCVTIKIKATEDNLLEIDDETLKLNATSAGYTPLDQASIIIKDKTNGEIIVETATPASGEMAEPSTHGSFRVRFKDTNVKTAKKIKVIFSLTDAVSGVDYEPVSPTEVEILVGDSEAVVPITVHNNYMVQGNRILKIEITSAVQTAP